MSQITDNLKKQTNNNKTFKRIQLYHVTVIAVVFVMFVYKIVCSVPVRARLDITLTLDITVMVDRV